MTRRPTSSRHGQAKKSNIPTRDMAKQKPELHIIKEKSMAPEHRAPHSIRLHWDRADGLEKVNVDVKPSFVHERIHPQQLADSLVQRSTSDNQSQGDLFRKEFNNIPKGQEWDFHLHADWTNRLIHGNSIEVMTSLLEEQPLSLAGKVQVIYFDPPYGIDYAGIRKPGTADTDRGEGSVVAHRAFVDSYVRTNPDGSVTKGLHPYLDGIYRHAVLAQRLLTESGSLFLQISQVNVNRVAVVLDEVFGEDNRVSMIKFQTGATETRMLARSGDFILWYAKDRGEAQEAFNAIYEKRSKEEYMEEAGANAIGLHPDGRIRTWPQLKSEYGDDIPKEWKTGRKDGITSQHQGSALQSRSWPRCETCPGGKGCNTENCEAPEYQENPSKYRESLPCAFNVRPGISGPDPSAQWRVNNPAGLDRLAAKNRLCVSVRTQDGKDAGVRNVRELTGEIRAEETERIAADGGLLQRARFFDEDPGKKLIDNWKGGLVRTTGKLFVVQTPEKFIERCILMASKPGDLVLDPTCGSGTTAVCAERHGRRWVTSDAGAWQIAVARERILTTIFDSYHLRGTEAGHAEDKRMDVKHGTNLAPTERPAGFDERDPAQGFVYDRRPDITAGTLSRDDEIPSIPLVDRPIRVPGGANRRVASAFTVECLAPYEIVNTRQVVRPQGVTPTSRRVSERLEGHVLSGEHILNNIRDRSSLPDETLITHEGEINGQKTAVWIAQPSHVVSEYEINKAAGQAASEGFKNLVIAAFGYHDAISASASPPRMGAVRTWCLHVPGELTIGDTKAEKTNIPVLLAEPSCTVNREDRGMISVSVTGFTAWNPAEGREIGVGKPDDVQIIMVDTEYNGIQFNARLINFPEPSTAPSDPYRKALEGQKEKYRAGLAEAIGADKWKAIRSHTTLPFERPKNGAVAIRVITINGDTITRVVEEKDFPES